MRSGIPGEEGRVKIMRGKLIVAWGLTFVLAAMAGCGRTGGITDDYRSLLRERNHHPFLVKREITEVERRKLQGTEKIALTEKEFSYKSLVQKMLAALKGTKYKNYLLEENEEEYLNYEEQINIDLYRYAWDMMKKGRKEGKLPEEGGIGEEEDLDLSPAQQKKFATYDVVKIDNCIFYVYKGKVQEPFYVALSRDEEWQEALRAQGMGYVGELFRAGEDFRWEHPTMDVDSLMLENIFTFNGLSVSTGNSLFDLNIWDDKKAAWENCGRISAGVKWMEKYWDGDAWGMIRYTDGEQCDIMDYQVELRGFAADDDKDLVYFLEAVGNSGEERIEEIIYRASGRGEYMKKVPSYLQPTVISHLRGLGVSQKEAEGFVEKLPNKSGTWGDLKVAVDRKAGEITVYRPY